MGELLVEKRSGERAPMDLEKIHKVVTWAAEGLEKVSVSQVEMRSELQMYDGIRTEDIHDTMIKAAADLISEETPDYQYLAARLAIFHLRKKAYGQFEPPRLYDHVSLMVKEQRYDAALLADYTEEDFDAMDAFIDHGRDLTFSYAAVKQLQGNIWCKIVLRVASMRVHNFSMCSWPLLCLRIIQPQHGWTISNDFIMRYLPLNFRCQRQSCREFVRLLVNSLHVF